MARSSALPRQSSTMCWDQSRKPKYQEYISWGTGDLGGGGEEGSPPPRLSKANRAGCTYHRNPKSQTLFKQRKLESSSTARPISQDARPLNSRIITKVAANPSTSGISRASATIVDVLRRDARPSDVIAFFCGLHHHDANSNDTPGPKRLVVQLIAQLVSRLGTRSRSSEVARLRKIDLRSRPLKELVGELLNLLEVLPARHDRAVLCIVDSIDVFLTSTVTHGTRQEMLGVISSLVNAPSLMWRSCLRLGRLCRACGTCLPPALFSAGASQGKGLKIKADDALEGQESVVSLRKLWRLKVDHRYRNWES